MEWTKFQLQEIFGLSQRNQASHILLGIDHGGAQQVSLTLPILQKEL
jgi:hypothetical protein